MTAVEPSSTDAILGGTATGTTAEPTPTDGVLGGNTIFVTNTNDSGAGSLRQAVLHANAATEAKIIVFQGPTFSDRAPVTIQLTSGELTITNTITIRGTGASLLTISGGNTSRVFFINSGVMATLNDLTIANGRADNGGGISNQGRLTLNNITLNSNQADRGGGIVNIAFLTINNSTLSRNFATIKGGGIYNGTTGVLTINNSTVSNNSSSNDGGGIFNSSDASSNGQVTVDNSTVTGNSSGGHGGGIWSSGAVTVSNSIWAGNSAQGGAEVYNYSYPGNSFASGGYNQVGQYGDAGGFPTTNTDSILAGAVPPAIQPQP